MTPADPPSPALDPNATTLPPVRGVNLLAEPSFEDCIAHHSRYSDDHNAGRITLRGIPDGHYIAYYDGQIRDHDTDPDVLLKRVAASLKVHPARIFVHYPWMW
jgi:hypothetical protein